MEVIPVEPIDPDPDLTTSSWPQHLQRCLPSVCHKPGSGIASPPLRLLAPTRPPVPPRAATSRLDQASEHRCGGSGRHPSPCPVRARPPRRSRTPSTFHRAPLIEHTSSTRSPAAPSRPVLRSGSTGSLRQRQFHAAPSTEREPSGAASMKPCHPSAAHLPSYPSGPTGHQLGRKCEAESIVSGATSPSRRVQPIGPSAPPRGLRSTCRIRSAAIPGRRHPPTGSTGGNGIPLVHEARAIVILNESSRRKNPQRGRGWSRTIRHGGIGLVVPAAGAADEQLCTPPRLVSSRPPFPSSDRLPPAVSVSCTAIPVGANLAFEQPEPVTGHRVHSQQRSAVAARGCGQRCAVVSTTSQAAGSLG
jgi:hypothetical protein